MTWLQRYRLTSFLASSLWIIPVLGMALALAHTSIRIRPPSVSKSVHVLPVCHVLVSYYAIRPYVFECDLIVSAGPPEVPDSLR